MREQRPEGGRRDRQRVRAGRRRGPEPRRAFSPYGLSKGLTWQVAHILVRDARRAAREIRHRQSVRPVRGAALRRLSWSSVGRRAKPPKCERPTICATISMSICWRALMRASSRRRRRAGAGRRFGPCGYLETQGAFAERLARELAPRLGVEGRVRFAEQTDFSEPLARVNSDPIDPRRLRLRRGRGLGCARGILAASRFRRAKACSASGATAGNPRGRRRRPTRDFVAGWLTARQGANPSLRASSSTTSSGARRAPTPFAKTSRRRISDGYSGYRFYFADALDPYVDHALRVEDRDTGQACRAGRLRIAEAGRRRADRHSSAIATSRRQSSARRTTRPTTSIFCWSCSGRRRASAARERERDAGIHRTQALRASLFPDARRHRRARDRESAPARDSACAYRYRFAEAEALDEPSACFAVNFVPVAAARLSRDVARENMERVSGPGRVRSAVRRRRGWRPRYRIEALVKHHFGRGLRDFGRVSRLGRRPGPRRRCRSRASSRRGFG